ncbi:hypothetical protein GALL_109850 [mine drainage metagenome]|uniref:Uncharacterized protein n=1 Tax=mine drainage metagenome TaxID=410659 RepID=A0A1J5SE70_9ZZZZ
MAAFLARIFLTARRWEQVNYAAFGMAVAVYGAWIAALRSQ